MTTLRQIRKSIHRSILRVFLMKHREGLRFVIMNIRIHQSELHMVILDNESFHYTCSCGNFKAGVCLHTYAVHHYCGRVNEMGKNSSHLNHSFQYCTAPASVLRVERRLKIRKGFGGKQE